MGYLRKEQRAKVKEQIIALYHQHKRQYEIELEVGVCSHIIKRYLSEENLYSRGRREDFFNENYFEKIDSEDKAYFLGLLYADGNIYLKRRRVQITLQNEDAYILEIFKKYINSSTKLYIDREKYSKLILDSDKLSQDLIKLGCIPNKSLTLKFPTTDQVPIEWLSHFVRGYFDGDGGITVGKSGLNISFTSSEVFLTSLRHILNKLNIETTEYKKRYKDKKISAGSIGINKKASQRLLFVFLYKDCKDLYLTRKENKFHKISEDRILRFCSLCNNKHFAKSFCKKHYRVNYFKIKGK